MLADVDDDNDGVEDVTDAFPTDASESKDQDLDGVGDNADAFPLDASETLDTDGDGVGDNADAFDLDASESVDTDGDLIGNNADTDDDNDGVLDTADAFSLISLGSLTDTDGDGRPNDCDSDCTTLGITPRNQTLAKQISKDNSLLVNDSYRDAGSISRGRRTPHDFLNTRRLITKDERGSNAPKEQDIELNSLSI